MLLVQHAHLPLRLLIHKPLLGKHLSALTCGHLIALVSVITKKPTEESTNASSSLVRIYLCEWILCELVNRVLVWSRREERAKVNIPSCTVADAHAIAAGHNA
jgi:hypothetical protein